MKEVKLLEVADVELRLTRTPESTLLTVAGREVSHQEVSELVRWLQTEVLGVSNISGPPLGSTGTLEKTLRESLSSTSPQMFPPLEARTTGRSPVGSAPVIEATVNPEEFDPLAERHVDPAKRGKYAQITDPEALKVSTAGLEVRGGTVDRPFQVKL